MSAGILPAARSPPRLRASLGRAVLVHRTDRLGGPCGVGFRAIRGARKSCVLMRDNAKSCNRTTVVGRSLRSPVHAEGAVADSAGYIADRSGWEGHFVRRIELECATDRRRVSRLPLADTTFCGGMDVREAGTAPTSVSRGRAVQYCSFEISTSRSSERAWRSW